jgi:hypothetical protein
MLLSYFLRYVAATYDADGHDACGHDADGQRVAKPNMPPLGRAVNNDDERALLQ